MDEMGADFVGGLELGAVPLTAIAVAMSDKKSPRRGFMVRKEPKGRGEGKPIIHQASRALLLLQAATL
jgi:Orotate phosphoribosyltransferase